MNVCHVCQADGVLQSAGQWYCKDHLDDGFMATVVMIARIKGNDEDRAAMQAAAWIPKL